MSERAGRSAGQSRQASPRAPFVQPDWKVVAVWIDDGLQPLEPRLSRR